MLLTPCCKYRFHFLLLIFSRQKKKKKIPTAQGMRSAAKLHYQHRSLVTSSGTLGIFLLCKYPLLSQVCGAAGREKALLSVVSQCDWLQRVK